MKVRIAQTPEDFVNIVDLGEDLFKATTLNEYGGYDKEKTFQHVAKSSQSPDADFLIAYDDENAMLGYCGIAIYSQFFTSEVKMGHINAWWVAKGERGSGVGRFLLDEAEKWSKEHGANALAVSALVGHDYNGSSAVYKKCGFRKLDMTYVKGV